LFFVYKILAFFMAKIAIQQDFHPSSFNGQSKLVDINFQL